LAIYFRQTLPLLLQKTKNITTYRGRIFVQRKDASGDQPQSVFPGAAPKRVCSPAKKIMTARKGKEVSKQAASTPYEKFSVHT
jgi:hypothetical protein